MKERLTSRDLQAQATREKLLRTSMELIAKEDYRSVTVSRICKACGVSVGTFYQYFSSKRDIILLLKKDFNERVAAEAREIDFSQSARKIYLDYVRLNMENMKRNGLTLSRSLVLSMLMEQAPVPDPEGPRKKFFSRLVERGRETGEFPPDGMDAWEFTRLYYIFVNGVLVAWFYSGGELDVVEYGCRHGKRLVELLEWPER